jgi:hypothetical protein
VAHLIQLRTSSRVRSGRQLRRCNRVARFCSVIFKFRRFRLRNLASVNERRETLALPKIEKLSADTKLDAGLLEAGKAPEFNKQSVLRDLKALSETTGTFPDLGNLEATGLLSGIVRLEADPALLDALQQRSLIEKGLGLVDGPDCPLCDHPWEDEQRLREHLKGKLAKSEEAAKLREALLNDGAELARHAVVVLGLLGQALKIAEGQGASEFARLLAAWTADLEELKGRLTNLDGLIGHFSQPRSSA